MKTPPFGSGMSSNISPGGPPLFLPALSSAKFWASQSLVPAWLGADVAGWWNDGTTILFHNVAALWLIFVMILWFGGQLKLWLSNCESVWKQDSCQKAGKVPFLKQLKGFVRAAILFKVPWKGFRLHLTTFLGGSKSRGPSQHPCSERRVPRFPPSACQEI